MHKGLCVQVGSRDFHVQVCLPSALKLHDQPEEIVQGCSGDRVVAGVVEDMLGAEFAHLVLAAFDHHEFGGADFDGVAKMYFVESELVSAGAVNHIFLRRHPRHCLLDALLELAQQSPTLQRAGLAFECGDSVVIHLVVVQPLLGQLLQAQAVVLVHIRGLELGVQPVGQVAVEPVVSPLGAPLVEQDGALKLGVVDHLRHAVQRRDEVAQIFRLHAVGVNVINRDVDGVLLVGAEGQRHARQLRADHVHTLAVILCGQPVI